MTNDFLTIRPELPPLPELMRDLPIDERGYPVPKFVQWINGKPDFRIMRIEHWEACIKKTLCWVCGKPFTNRRVYFVIGPMCAVNRTTAEPPCHKECAEYSARGCPFLSRPHMHRREDELSKLATQSMPGTAILRNPGCAIVWCTRHFSLFRDGKGGYLIELGEPDHIEAYTQGKLAPRAAVLESITSGLPLLEAEALKDVPEAMGELETAVARALKLIEQNIAA
jgi:hypothetical protein